MSGALLYWDAALAVAKRDFRLFLTFRTRTITQLASAVFGVALFYYISRLVSGKAFSSPDAYFAFVIVGLVVLRVLTSSLSTSAAGVRQELVAGTFERMVASPFGAVGGIASLLIFPFLFAVLMSIVTLGVAVVLFGVDLRWSTVPLAVPAGVLGALAFTPFALAIAAAVVIFKQAAGGATLLISVIGLVSGLYFPPSLLPEWLRWAADVQPFTPAADLLRHLLVGSELRDPVWVEVATLLGFAAVLLPLSVWLLHLSVRAARRRATITES